MNPPSGDSPSLTSLLESRPVRSSLLLSTAAGSNFLAGKSCVGEPHFACHPRIVPSPSFLTSSPWSGQESQAPLGDDLARLDIAAQILLLGSLNQLPRLPAGDPSPLIYFCQ